MELLLHRGNEQQKTQLNLEDKDAFVPVDADALRTPRTTPLPGGKGHNTVVIDRANLRLFISSGNRILAGGGRGARAQRL